MADPGKSMRQYMLSKTAVTDVIGQRFYAKRLPQNATVPAVAYRTLTESHDHALDGLAGMVSTRIQYECFAANAESARSLAYIMIGSEADQIKGLTHGTNVRSVMVEDGVREYEDEDTEGGDYQRHVASFDLMVHWLRS